MNLKLNSPFQNTYKEITVAYQFLSRKWLETKGPIQFYIIILFILQLISKAPVFNALLSLI